MLLLLNHYPIKITSNLEYILDRCFMNALSEVAGVYKHAQLNTGNIFSLPVTQ